MRSIYVPSNCCLLWLHSGYYNQQASGTSQGVESHIFNISDPFGTSTCTSASPTSSLSHSSSVVQSPSTATGVSTGTGSDAEGSTTTTDVPLAPPTNSIGTTMTAAAAPTDTTHPGPQNGIPTGTIVGTVINVCLFDLPGLLGCVLYFWRQGKKPKMGETAPDEFLKGGKDANDVFMSTANHPAARPRASSLLGRYSVAKSRNFMSVT